MRYKVSRQQAQTLPAFHIQEVGKIRAILTTFRGTRLEVIFGYELYYVEHCFLRAERKGSLYWAEKGLQRAEKLIEAAKSYPRALEESVRKTEDVNIWTWVSRVLRWRWGRSVGAQVERRNW